MSRAPLPLRALIAALVLLLASSAAAEGWKTQVTQAGGFWSGSLGSQGWQKMLDPNPTRTMARLPQGVQTMLKAEVVDNPWIKGHAEMKKKLGKFRPEARQVFDLPYIPIPADKMKFNYVSSGIGANMKRNVAFKKGGKDYVRYFFHPLYADKYKELIETYGVKYGEYQATCTSSPRSLVAWKKTQPGKPIWVKVSVHAHLDYYKRKGRDGKIKKVGISRVQSEKKARRSALVNAAFNSAGRSTLGRHKVDFMAEPASFVPGDIQYKGRRKGFDRATIFRELPAGLTSSSSGKRYVPAFTFIKNMKPTLQRINAARAQAGKKPVNPIGWMTKGLIEPLVRTYIHLGVEHGLQGELHTQNFLLQVDKKGVPTGKVMVKDLDGFRMDLDMRIRNGKSVKFLKHYKNPFKWAKHSATQGSSSNPAVLQGWFNKLIRNVNGFTTTRTVNGRKEKVYATPAGQLMVQLKKDFPQAFATLKRGALRRDPGLQGNASKTERKAVEQVFDLVARAQFRRQTGIRVEMKNWGYGQKKGLNRGLNRLRGALMKAQPGVGASFDARGKVKVGDRGVQTVLKQHFTRAKSRGDNRTWSPGRKARSYRMVRDGVIEGLSATGLHAGYAILKPDQARELKRTLGQRGQSLSSRRPTTHLSRYAGQDRRARTPFGRWLGRGRTHGRSRATIRNRTRTRNQPRARTRARAR